jgi:hypothetical protein
MPSTHSDSMLRFFVAVLNRGWVQTAPQHCNKESELPRFSSDACSLNPIRNGIHWHIVAQNISSVHVFGGIATASASARSAFEPRGRRRILFNWLKTFFTRRPVCGTCRAVSTRTGIKKVLPCRNWPVNIMFRSPSWKRNCLLWRSNFGGNTKS